MSRFGDELTIVHLQLSASTSNRWSDRLRHKHRIGLEVLRKVSRLERASVGSDTKRCLVIIDGAEQLSCFARHCVLRKSRRNQFLVLGTSHRPLAGLKVLHETQVCETLIRSLAESLLADSPTMVQDLVDQQLSVKDLTKLTNVRELWFELYDLVQAKTAPSAHPSVDQHSIL